MGQQVYSWTFVLIVMAASFFVMGLSYEQGYEQFEANFYGRYFLIENFDRLRIKLGDRVFPSVLIGNDGWMEFTEDHNLDDYQNAVDFSPEALQAAAERIESCYQYAREQNITFLIVVAPNKASIYPEKLPPQLEPISQLSRLDQLNAYLRAHHIPEVLDLRPALRSARQERELYHQLGTHWNDYGAYIAYETIINVLSQDHPELKPYAAKFFRFRTVPGDKIPRRDRALANLLQANYLAPEPTWFATRDLDSIVYKIDFGNERLDYHRITWLPDSNLPSLLIVHDSFGVYGLNQFLALNFGKASFVHRASSYLYLSRKALKQFSPGFLIYQVVERDLYMLPKDLLACARD